MSVGFYIASNIIDNMKGITMSTELGYIARIRNIISSILRSIPVSDSLGIKPNIYQTIISTRNIKKICPMEFNIEDISFQ